MQSFIVLHYPSTRCSLRNLQRKTMNAQDRQLTTAFGAIKDMADRKHMPSCVVVCFRVLFLFDSTRKHCQEQAKLIYKNGIDSGALKNKNTNAAAAAALYIACRKEEVRSFVIESPTRTLLTGPAHFQRDRCSRRRYSEGSRQGIQSNYQQFYAAQSEQCQRCRSCGVLRNSTDIKSNHCNATEPLRQQSCTRKQLKD